MDEHPPEVTDLASRRGSPPDAEPWPPVAVPGQPAGGDTTELGDGLHHCGCGGAWFTLEPHHPGGTVGLTLRRDEHGELTYGGGHHGRWRCRDCGRFQ
jgi:hypothetical protein